jgi:glyoxylase-like metal-dependent hydrolase (beta-lactamase superfamily II)
VQRFRELAPGVLVATAEMYTTTSTVVTGDAGGCLLVDPAVTVAEVASLAADLAGAGLTPRAGFATHPHWDHLLWSRGLGAGVPRYAAADAVRTAERERAGLISGVEEAAPGHDLDLFGRLVPLAADVIPWEGPAAQVIVHDGHAAGHGAVFLPDTGVLLAGDMLSDIEIPMLDFDQPGAAGRYRAGLERLAAVPGVRWLVPGHGHVTDGAGFRQRLAADQRYLDQLTAGRPFEDRRCAVAWLRELHASQLEAISAAESS